MWNERTDAADENEQTERDDCDTELAAHDPLGQTLAGSRKAGCGESHSSFMLLLLFTCPAVPPEPRREEGAVDAVPRTQAASDALSDVRAFFCTGVVSTGVVAELRAFCHSMKMLRSLPANSNFKRTKHPKLLFIDFVNIRSY